jgi:hypothetical protein
MRGITTAMLIVGLALSGATLIGCDDEIATEKSVDVRGDKVVTNEKTVSETPDGGVKVEESKTVDKVD